MKTLFLVFVLLSSCFIFRPKARAQAPVINSFSQNGQLVCANLQTGTVASVEWASSLAGPWQTNWAGLEAVAVESNGTISVSVPMFYRVRGVPQQPPPGMVLISAGSFMMGDALDGFTNAMLTNVTVSAFYMDENLVSESEWQVIHDYATNNGYVFSNAGSGKGTNHPVQTVSWDDAVKWSNARSQEAGLTPVYYTDAALTAIYTNGAVAIYVNGTAQGYRLPTEAEWEKAARGGLNGKRFPWGDTISETQANYFGCTSCSWSYDAGPDGYNSVGSIGGTSPATSPVGSFPANGYGLYDMAGNVFEWCWDWYGTPYGQPTTTNPTGPTMGSERIVRGGAWSYYAVNPGCAHRDHFPPASAFSSLGFRCVRGL